MSIPEFRAFASIPRLFRGVTVTEKIDGTNAQVYISDDLETVAAGSRNRWITPDDDNFGFAAWVAEHRNELRALGPGRHYGEYWGSGIQRGYGLRGERRFSLFNVARWHRVEGEPFVNQPSDPRMPPRLSTEAPACCHVVPVLYRGAFDTTDVQDVLDDLGANGSKAVPGFTGPEGIVVFHEASGANFKVTLGGDGHKGAR